MICMVESTYIILRSKIWSLMVYKRYCNVDSSYNYALYMYNNTFKMVKIQDFGCFLPARAIRFTCTELEAKSNCFSSSANFFGLWIVSNRFDFERKRSMIDERDPTVKSIILIGYLPLPTEHIPFLKP